MLCAISVWEKKRERMRMNKTKGDFYGDFGSDSVLKKLPPSFTMRERMIRDVL